MNKEKTVSEWIDYYKSQKDYMEGWYDWFCMDKSLKAKTENFSKILERLVNAQPKIGSAYRVWFKNNCPMNGSLYDDLRFEYIKDGKELDGEERMKYYFVISIDSPTAKQFGKYELYDGKTASYSNYSNVYELTKAVKALVDKKLA